MRGMPFNAQGKGALQVLVEANQELESTDNYWRISSSCKRYKFGGKEGVSEPRSVLDHTRSPSPPTSSSTLSSSLGGGGGVAAVSETNAAHEWPQTGGSGAQRAKDEWPLSDLQPIPAGLEMGFAGGSEKLDDWEAMLSDSAAGATAVAASPGQEHTFLRWIMGGSDESAGGGGGLKQQHQQLGFEESNNGGLGFGLADPTGIELETIPPPLASTVSNNISLLPLSRLPPGMLFQEPAMEDKPLLFGPPSLLLNQQQQPHSASNPAFFLPLPSYSAQTAELQPPPLAPQLLPPQPKRHHPMAGNPTCPITPTIAGPDLFLRRNQIPPVFPPPLQFPPQPRPMLMKPKPEQSSETQTQQPPPLVEQLLEAAKMVETGNITGARGILARLNHQLTVPAGKPLLRSAFYFKEALNQILAGSPVSASPVSTPYDVAIKLGAHKAFSELSPILHFTNFTSVQAMLDELSGANRIHVIDFDIGIGGQWSSFMQEIAQRRCNTTGAIPMLKITAFVTPPSHHPLELHLVRANLCHFASDLNIPFEFSLLSLESFDPAELLAVSGGTEAIAVNLPVGSAYGPSFPTLLRLVRQLSPRIVVSVDHGCDRGDLPFSPHFYHAFQSCMSLLDSLDSVGPTLDTANKIERFVLQPRVEASVIGRHRVGDKMLTWRTLFASAGFVPVQFSNFAEAQAECLAKRVQVKGFHVERRQGSLVLYWQRGELVSVSAWRGC